MTIAPLITEATRRYHDALAARHLASMRARLDRPELSYCQVLRPHFVAGETYAHVLEVTKLLNRGVVDAADRLARDADARRKLGIPDFMDPLIELDREHGRPSLMARFDGFVDRDGVFRVIEYNANPGFENSVAADAAFASSPMADELAQAFAFRTMRLDELMFDALALDQERHGGGGLPVIGRPVTPRTAQPDYMPGWFPHVESRGCKIVVAPYDEFRLEGGRLVVGGVAIDTVLPVWEDLLEQSGSRSPIFEAIEARAVRTVQGLSRGFLASYKHTFEILSHPEYASWFPPDVAAALARHLPWTRVLRNVKTPYGAEVVDLLPFVIQNRERMVLKPSGGSAGNGVLLGSRCSPADWKQEIKRALRQKYVVQERVYADVESYPLRPGEGTSYAELTPTLEPFVWNGDRPVGAMARVASGMHTAPDGGFVPALWVIDAAK